MKAFDMDDMHINGKTTADHLYFPQKSRKVLLAHDLNNHLIHLHKV
jgi:hypothetical protein